MNSICCRPTACFFGALFLSFGGLTWFANRPAESISTGPIITRQFRPGVDFQEPASQVPADQETAPPTFPPADELVKSWQKPDVCLFISGELHGYIEPCGCTGLANQKGGLLRRHTVLKILQDRGWDVIPIDSGNVIRRIGIQAQMQLDLVYKALNKTMNYSSIAVGHEDLKSSGTDLAQIMVNSFEKQNPFLSCNVVVLDESLSNKFQIIERNGKKIGVTSVLCDEHRGMVKDPDIKTRPMADGLKEVIPLLQKEKCDLLLLMADGTLEECRNLAKQFPVFDVLVTTGGEGDPTMLPEIIAIDRHATNMIQVGVKGMHVGLIGLYSDPKQEIRYERVPLDARYDDSPEIKVLFSEYQDRLKLKFEEPASFSDILPRKHSSGYTFVGSQACQECHQKEYDIWLDGVDGPGGEPGPHSIATKDLTDPGERTWVKRNFDPECLSCHVTGWNPQNYFPYESGYLNLEKDVTLHGNGCENCHGPGSEHVIAENKQNPAAEEVLKKLRKEMKRTLKQAREGLCAECHDLDNSPDFLLKLQEGSFEKYWAKIKH